MLALFKNRYKKKPQTLFGALIYFLAAAESLAINSFTFLIDQKLATTITATSTILETTYTSKYIRLSPLKHNKFLKLPAKLV